MQIRRNLVCLEKQILPECLADQEEQVMEGGSGFGIPGSLLTRHRAIEDECIGHENDQEKEAEKCRGRAFDMIVDGGLLSNFPMSLFLSNDPAVNAVIGPASTKNVLGLLLDETLQVPNLPPRPSGPLAAFQDLRLVQQLQKYANMAASSLLGE